MFLSLKKNNEIVAVIKKGKKKYLKNMTLHYLKNNSIIKSKVAISVSKKNFKLAVIRNKIRRQIKAILIQSKILDLKTNVLLVITVKDNYDINNFLETKINITNNLMAIGG